MFFFDVFVVVHVVAVDVAVGLAGVAEKNFGGCREVVLVQVVVFVVVVAIAVVLTLI